MALRAHEMPPLPSEALRRLPVLSSELLEEETPWECSGETLLGPAVAPEQTVKKRPIKVLGDAGARVTEQPQSAERVSQTTRTHIHAGDVLLGRYEVLGLLGSGRDSYVLRAYHRGFDCEVALKFLRSELVDDVEARMRFGIEAKYHLLLRSEHITRVFDVERMTDGRPFLVMERLHGYDLRVALNDHVRLSVERALLLALQGCEALAVAHAANVVHGRLQPETLFLSRPHGDEQLKVMDFGACTDGYPSRGLVTTIDGNSSPPYISPEQMQGERADARSDIWSLGCVLYEMLSGRPPFRGKTLHESCAAVLEARTKPLSIYRPELPEALEDVVMRCLSKDPRHRFPSATALARGLAPFAPPQAQAHVVRCTQHLEEDELGRITLSPLELTRPREPAKRSPKIVHKPGGSREPVPVKSWLKNGAFVLGFAAASALMLRSGSRRSTQEAEARLAARYADVKTGDGALCERRD